MLPPILTPPSEEPSSGPRISEQMRQDMQKEFEKKQLARLRKELNDTDKELYRKGADALNELKKAPLLKEVDTKDLKTISISTNIPIEPAYNREYPPLPQGLTLSVHTPGRDKASNKGQMKQREFVIKNNDEAAVSPKIRIPGGEITFHAVRAPDSYQTSITIVFEAFVSSGLDCKKLHFIQIAKNSADKPYWDLDGAEKLHGDSNAMDRWISNPEWNNNAYPVQWPIFNVKKGEYARWDDNTLKWHKNGLITSDSRYGKGYALMRDMPGPLYYRMSGSTEHITAIVSVDFDKETGVANYTWIGYVQWKTSYSAWPDETTLTICKTGAISAPINVQVHKGKQNTIEAMSIQELFQRVMKKYEHENNWSVKFFPEIDISSAKRGWRYK